MTVKTVFRLDVSSGKIAIGGVMDVMIIGKPGAMNICNQLDLS